MRTTIREVTAWAPMMAALSLLLFALALALWPLRAGGLFAALLGLDALTWQPAHGWTAVALGVVVWAAASYAAAAALWMLGRWSRRLLRALAPQAPPSAFLRGEWH